jgi:hypothetical protein
MFITVFKETATGPRSELNEFNSQKHTALYLKLHCHVTLGVRVEELVEALFSVRNGELVCLTLTLTLADRPSVAM